MRRRLTEYEKWQDTGRTYELKYLGAISVCDKELQESMKWYDEAQKKRDKKRGVLGKVKRDFYDAPPRFERGIAFEQVRELQKDKAGIPDSQKQPLLHDLRIEIMDRLEERGATGIKDEDVLAYTAIIDSPYKSKKTCLDFHYGVDAFLDINVGKERFTITLDIKLSGDHTAAKADVVIPELSDPRTEMDIYLEEVEDIASKVMKCLEERANI